jgi:hypothetical protein
MLTRTHIVRVLVAIAVLGLMWVLLGNAVARKDKQFRGRRISWRWENPRSSSCFSLWIPTRTAKPPSKSG